MDIRDLEERIENENKVIIEEGFNARIGNKGEILHDGEEDKETKISKNIVINRQGEKLLEFIEKMGLAVLNGNIKGDMEGKWTFNGKVGSSVIDYVLSCAESWDEIKEFRIAERTESDHMPLEVELELEKTGIEGTTEEVIEIEDWSENGIK